MTVPPKQVHLTEEQQLVVAHNEGPALVFAVAGAGKTTTMVRRIERLVREERFKAEHILATSFSKATVDDLKKALSVFPHARKVQVKTLHALAFQILRDARTQNLGLALELPKDVESAPHAILNRALTTARAKGVPFVAELDTLDRDDFLTYVGGCKATLAFTKDRFEELPATSSASLAERPASLRWYLELFSLYELARLEMGLLTFDDLVPEAWLNLIQHMTLAERYQRKFDTLLVDEFQDTNLSQVELLDILVAPHKNIMVCGDDDQGIFGFRKASNQFILNFAKRYGAVSYRISDNFRCFAEHTILANHVIHRNSERAPKQLTPARGFGGQTLIESHGSAEMMGSRIAARIREAIDEGLRPDEIAVLVRLYAETGVVEAALIEEGIAYRIVGNVPFYDRPENTLLLNYLQVALIDRRAADGLGATDKALLSDIWWDVLRIPKRYVRRDASDTLLRDILINDTPPSAALLTAGGISGYAGPKLVALGQTLAWLGEAAETGASAYALLLELEQRLDYQSFLLENSGFVETGQAKVQTVKSFIEYAKGKGDAASFLTQIERARTAHQGKRDAQVVISSIFRAKGLEWPHVIVPAVNYGHLPAAGNDTDLSEERRLFYVALTRAKATLDLHVIKNRPPSIFMEGLSNLQDAAQASRAAFNGSISSWTAREALSVAEVYRYLDRFVDEWSGLDEPSTEQVAQWVLAANQAWSLKSSTPLPRKLERKLRARMTPDEAKVEACAIRLGVMHRMATRESAKQQASQQRAFSPSQEGQLAKGTRVRHKLHGEGKVVKWGTENAMQVVEVAFDKGRTVKLMAEHAKLEVLV